MLNITYSPPSGPDIILKDLQIIKKIISEPSKDFWYQGSAGVRLITFTSFGQRLCIIIEPDPDLCFYIHYKVENEGPLPQGTWNSIDNPDNLHTYKRLLYDELYDENGDSLPLGVFLPPEKAWWVVEEFCRSGKRTDKILWYTDAGFPEDVKWL